MINDNLTSDSHEHIFDLHIYPTYAVKIPQRPKRVISADQIQKANAARKEYRELQAKHIQELGILPPVMSVKATKRLRNSVNWLIASAKSKRIFSKTNGKSFTFKVNFITLTLPTTEHNISDATFKNVFLHTFINNLRNKYNMVNFVWKVEAQENGNIHAHFATDIYINWEELRMIWNRILINNGVMDSYTKKFTNLTFEEYVNMSTIKDKSDLQSLKKAFNYGVSTGWKNPNTTDVHAVYKVKDIGAYLAKYFSKSDNDRRRITGRVWSCSYGLSSKNKLIVECTSNGINPILDELNKPEIYAKELIQENKKTGSTFAFGVCYFYKLEDWGVILKGELLQKFNEYRFRLRNGVSQLFDLQPIIETSILHNEIEKQLIPDNLFLTKEPNLIYNWKQTSLWQN